MSRLNASAFTFVHNGIASGYPIVEAIQAVADYVHEVVVCDIQSTDRTREVLEWVNQTLPARNLRIIEGVWTPGTAGECLRIAHARHVECKCDQIIHFEADEVYSPELMANIRGSILNGVPSFNVLRIQVEQNFQRARWYPEKVHRVFLKGTVTKHGHTTTIGDGMPVLEDAGLLWDCASTWRDNYIPRMRKQAELWGHPEPIYRLASHHFMQPPIVLDGSDKEDRIALVLSLPRWTWKTSPFNLPPSLADLVGEVKYEPLD